MAQKIRRVGKASLSIILTLMMIVSMVAVGMIGTQAYSNGTVTVYFKNTVNWSNVYVYFYTSTYWNDSNGSGSNNIAGGPYSMTKVSGTDDVYSYTYTGNYSGIISFTKDSQSNYNNFWQTSAVYRTDFSSGKMYTPNTTSSGTYNSSVPYYNNGTWSTYVQNYSITCNSAVNGSISPSVSSASSGSTVTITATPNTGYELSTMTAKDASNNTLTMSGSGNSRSFTMPSSNVTVNATFTKKGNDVTFSQPINGSVKVNNTTSSPVTVAENESYTVTLTPNTGYEVDTFTVGGVDKKASLSNNTCTLTMGTSNVAVVATFKKSTYTITKGEETNGTFTVSSSASYGDTVNVTDITPESGYELSALTYTPDGGSAQDIKTAKSFTMPAKNVTVNAVFSKINYTITDNSTNGSVSTSVNGVTSNTFNIGDTLVFTPTANNGYSFDKLLIDGAEVSTTGGSYTIDSASSANLTVEAQFVANTYNITYGTATGGSISGNATASYGSTVTVTVNADAGYELASISGVSATKVDDSTYTFTMPAEDVTLTPLFNSKSVTPPRISINGGTSSATVTGLGNSLTLLPNVYANENFASVDSDNCSFTKITKNGVTKTLSDYVTYSQISGYKFSANEPGTYVVTYTGTVKSNVDSTKTASNTATFTITVQATATQTAYSNLKTAITTYTVADSSIYDTTSDIYKAYLSALNAAKLLAGDGTTMPSYTATNTADYTDAQTTLSSAYAALENCKKQTAIYVLSSYSSDIKLWMWPTGGAGSAISMTKVASYTVSGSTKYLWKYGFDGTSNFIVYYGTGSISTDNKLTGDVPTCTTANASYYFDLKNTTVGSTTTTTYTTSPFKFLSASATDNFGNTTILPGDTVNLTTKYPVTYLSTLNSYSSCTYTTTYYVDGVKVTNPSSWTATSGNHSVYAVVTGGLANGSTTEPYESSKTETVNFAVGGTKIEFSANDSAMGSVTAVCNGSTITSGDYVATGSDVTFTATPASYQYSFSKWSNDSTTSTITLPANDSLNMVATFVENTARLITITPSAISGVSITSNPQNSAYKNQPVTVTVDTPDYYTVNSVTVDYQVDGETQTITVTSNDDGTYSFTMPDADVVISTNITEFNKVSVTSNTTGEGSGAVSISNETPHISEPITLTATPTAGSGDVFDGWTITGGYTSDGTIDLSASQITIKPTTDIVATAKFSKISYYIYNTTNGQKVQMTKRADGTYIATDIIPNNTYFTVSDSNNRYAISSSSTVTMSSSSTTANVSSWNTSVGNKYKISATNGAKVIFDPTANSGKGSLTFYNCVSTVYAKYGTVRDNGSSDTYNNTDLYGVTALTSGSLSDGGITQSSGHNAYHTYTAEKNTLIEFTTTLNSSYKTAGYYVAGFCVNGKTVQAVDKGNGVFEGTYKMGEDDVVELTPVYYNSNIDNDDNYITYYADASAVSDDWGNTISTYSWYSDGDGDGAYPGQPMLLGDNGLYYAKIAKVHYVYSNGSVTNNGNPVLGITNSSYIYDKVHNIIVNNGTYTAPTKANQLNHQTYDYDEFSIIAGAKGQDGKYLYDTVLFEIHDSASTTSNQSKIGAGNTHVYPTTTKISTSNFVFKPFTDYNKKDVSILGNQITDTNNKLYIVSVGNQQVGGTDNTKWAAYWYVYDKNGNYVTRGRSSDFIPRGYGSTNTTAYNDIVNAGYANCEATISYEIQMNTDSSVDDGNDGVRVDGRWYYANSDNVKTTSTVDIEYSTDGTNYVSDTNTNASNTNLPFVGQTTGSTASIDGQQTKNFEKINIQASLNANAGSDYSFDGWYILTTNNGVSSYREISKDLGYTVTVSSDQHYVARFTKIPAGSLSITHGKYAGDGAFGGAGYYYVSAIVKHNDGTTQTYGSNSTSNLSIPTISATDTITITLTTVCSGDNTFYSWYESVDGKYQMVGPEDNKRGSTGTVTYTFDLNASSLFNTDGTEAVSSLNFYSDIVPVSKKCKLTYKYLDRFGVQKSFITFDTLTDTDIQNNIANLGEDKKYYPTDSMVQTNAPAIDDLYKDCTWVIANVSKQGSEATLIAVQTAKTYDVKLYLDYVDITTDLGSQSAELISKSKLPLNSTVKNSSNDYYQPNVSDNFKYWSIYDVDLGKEVARCYSQKMNYVVAGNYIIYPVYTSETYLPQISDTQFTREQSTNADGTVKYDYLYTDFILQYLESGNATLINSVGQNEIQTGVVLEFGQSHMIDQADTAGGTYDVTASDKFDSTTTQIQNAALGDYGTDEEKATVGSSKSSYTYSTGDNRVLYNYEIDNSTYNNKNRTDFAVKFFNNSTYRHLIIKAYYYVIINGEVTLSEPTYFCLYTTGNSVHSVSDN